MPDGTSAQTVRRPAEEVRPPARTPPRDEPIGALLRSLRDDTQRLIRDEVALARAELNETVRSLRRRAVAFGIGLVLLLAGLFEALYALTRLLITWFSESLQIASAAWLAPAALAGVLFVVGYALVHGGAKGAKEDATEPAPETMESLRQDKAWVRDQVRQRT